MMNTVDFFKEGIKNIRVVGSLVPSSKSLCKNMIKHIDFSKANVIVELGAGEGVITNRILKAMPSDSILVAFEVNSKFCDILRAINDPRLIVIEDSAENIGQHLKEQNLGQIDYVLSAIPFVSLPKELSYNIVEEARKNMRPRGKYIQVHYSLLAKSMYDDIFGNVNVHFSPINVPPAFVLVSEKRP